MSDVTQEDRKELGETWAYGQGMDQRFFVRKRFNGMLWVEGLCSKSEGGFGLCGEARADGEFYEVEAKGNKDLMRCLVIEGNISEENKDLMRCLVIEGNISEEDAKSWRWAQKLHDGIASPLYGIKDGISKVSFMDSSLREIDVTNIAFSCVDGAGWDRNWDLFGDQTFLDFYENLQNVIGLLGGWITPVEVVKRAQGVIKKAPNPPIDNGFLEICFVVCGVPGRHCIPLENAHDYRVFVGKHCLENKSGEFLDLAHVGYLERALVSGLDVTTKVRRKVSLGWLRLAGDLRDWLGLHVVSPNSLLTIEYTINGRHETFRCPVTTAENETVDLFVGSDVTQLLRCPDFMCSGPELTEALFKSAWHLRWKAFVQATRPPLLNGRVAVAVKAVDVPDMKGQLLQARFRLRSSLGTRVTSPIGIVSGLKFEDPVSIQVLDLDLKEDLYLDMLHPIEDAKAKDWKQNVYMSTIIPMAPFRIRHAMMTPMHSPTARTQGKSTKFIFGQINDNKMHLGKPKPRSSISRTPRANAGVDGQWKYGEVRERCLLLEGSWETKEGKKERCIISVTVRVITDPQLGSEAVENGRDVKIGITRKAQEEVQCIAQFKDLMKLCTEELKCDHNLRSIAARVKEQQSQKFTKTIATFAPDVDGNIFSNPSQTFMPAVRRWLDLQTRHLCNLAELIVTSYRPKDKSGAESDDAIKLSSPFSNIENMIGELERMIRSLRECFMNRPFWFELIINLLNSVDKIVLIFASTLTSSIADHSKTTFQVRAMENAKQALYRRGSVRKRAGPVLERKVVDQIKALASCPGLISRFYDTALEEVSYRCCFLEGHWKRISDAQTLRITAGGWVFSIIDSSEPQCRVELHSFSSFVRVEAKNLRPGGLMCSVGISATDLTMTARLEMIRCTNSGKVRPHIRWSDGQVWSYCPDKPEGAARAILTAIATDSLPRVLSLYSNLLTDGRRALTGWETDSLYLLGQDTCSHGITFDMPAPKGKGVPVRNPHVEGTFGSINQAVVFGMNSALQKLLLLKINWVDSETLRKALSNVFATSSLLLDVFEDERVYTFPPHLLEALLKPIERRLLTIRTAYDHSKIALPARSQWALRNAMNQILTRGAERMGFCPKPHCTAVRIAMIHRFLKLTPGMRQFWIKYLAPILLNEKQEWSELFRRHTPPYVTSEILQKVESCMRPQTAQ
ncbi:hypothetical protein AAMO2058_001155300 [Amorphochlora amoebiformis]